MSTSDKPGIDSLGYTEAQMESIENIKAPGSAQVLGVTTSVKRAFIRQLVADFASTGKLFKACGKQD